MTKSAQLTTQPAKLTDVIAANVAAVNAFDLDGFVATFAPDALVNDNRREFWGLDQIRAFAAKELMGDRVTMEITEVIERGDETVVRAKYDGTYDKTNLPPVLVLTSYYRVRDGKIASLYIVFNK